MIGVGGVIEAGRVDEGGTEIVAVYSHFTSWCGLFRPSDCGSHHGVEERPVVTALFIQRLFVVLGELATTPRNFGILFQTHVPQVVSRAIVLREHRRAATWWLAWHELS